MDCPRCGTSNPPGARFCLNCGNQLAAPRAPEGERRFVTVLFADVVGSTALGELVDPEQVAEIMNGAFSFLNAAIDRYGGTVSRLMGDAILALFGAPVAHEDDAERAVHAGLEILGSARSYAGLVERDYQVGFQVRVGINSGLAVLAMVGDEVKTEYTAMGDTANLAARLQSAADPGTVLISAETEHLIRGAFDVRPRDAIELKGKSAPAATYEVIAAKLGFGRVRGLEGLSSPLVGRRTEVDLLRDRLEDARTGQGSAIAVIGEAGLGKSRLIAELRHGESGNTWLEGRALSYGQTIAYYPWRQIVRQRIGAHEIDPPDSVRARLAATVSAEDVPFLEAMLAVESEATQQSLARLRGDELVRGIDAAIRRLVLQSADGESVVLVFDDLHWADEASLQLLAGLSNLVETAPVVLICILRPDRTAKSWETIGRLRDQLGNRFRFAQVTLEPLSSEESDVMLANLLRIEGMPEDVRDLILRKSEGNPFFLEEVIRSLIDSGHILREDGAWRATQDILTVPIPDTLAGVLASRIDRLPEETKRVAQTAAVIGRIFRYPVLSAAVSDAPLPERIADPGSHVATLTTEELVRERARDPELEYIFKHALTQEAAYDLLLLRRRKEFHRRVGEVLERLYPDQVEDLAPMLLHHFWHAEEWERAARYAAIGAREAMRVYAVREALDHYDKAYQGLKRLPHPKPTDIIDVVLGWTEIATKQNKFDEALERLEEAEQLARAAGDRSRLAAVLGWKGNVHVTSGFPSKGMPVLIESYRLAEEAGDDRLVLLPTFMMTNGMVDRDPRAALESLDHVIELAEQYDQPEIESHAWAIKAVAQSRVGEFAAAEHSIRRAHEVAQRVHAPAKLADVNAATALAYYDMGLLDQGIESSRTATAKGLEGGVTECTLYSMYCTGLGQLHKSNLDEARRTFEEVLRLADSDKNIALPQFYLRGGLATISALSGEEGALETLEAAYASAHAMGDVYDTALYAQTLGEARMRLGDLAHADQNLGEALSYYRTRGMRPYLARALRLLAALREYQGRSGEAQDAREEADRLTEEMRFPATTPTYPGLFV